MDTNTRRALFGGALAVVIVGGTGFAAMTGSASAQTMPVPHARMGGQHDSMFASLAARLGISAEALQTAMDDTHANLGLGDRNGPAGPDAGNRYEMFETVAVTIGITEDQLQAELPGKSLAEVVQAHGADLTKVKEALIATATAQIDVEVAAGKRTADQATAMKRGLADRIDAMLTRKGPGQGMGDRGQGMGGRRGPGGQGGSGVTPENPGPRGNGGQMRPGGMGPRGQASAPGTSS